MTTIFAKVITDSVSQYGDRLATLHLRYPRLMHADFMTHRVFSRNASSNRAMPTVTVINNIDTDLVLPLKYYKNQKGMFGSDFLDEFSILKCEELIKKLWIETKNTVLELDKLTLHKQNKNRYLEPFQHIDVLLTTTEFDNFFNLRTALDAQPEIIQLALQIKESLQKSSPILLQENEWHLPFITEMEKLKFNIEILKKLSSSRCSRISYLKHDKTNPSVEEDIEQYNSLYLNKHMSPFEHPARPMSSQEEELSTFLYRKIKSNPEISKTFNNPYFFANHRGWVPLRRELENVT